MLMRNSQAYEFLKFLHQSQIVRDIENKTDKAMLDRYLFITNRGNGIEENVISILNFAF